MKYYEAYNERYKIIHDRGEQWTSNNVTSILIDTLKKYRISKDNEILEVGCGEGRDSIEIINQGYQLLATDISSEAISYCQKRYSNHKECFRVLDCLKDALDKQFDFIYSVAVLHMFVLDEDRQGFYRFINNHLKSGGLALICSMGDGEREYSSDIKEAFELKQRECHRQEVMVPATSCRVVNKETFIKEIDQSGLSIVEFGYTSIEEEFDVMMYAVIQKR